ncbi:DUF1826 domain-containing protein [Ekhidna sp.]
MNLFSFPFIRARYPKQVVSSSWEDRNVINDDDVNLYCWRRPVDMAISSYLGRLLESEIKPIQFNYNLLELDDCIERVRSEWADPNINALELFWEDVRRLASDFLSLSGCKSGTIHLKMIDNNSCAKFHTDGYTLRLFTTYYGMGTEWLPEKATNRRGLGKTNDLIVKDPEKIQRMEPFEVGILKGEIPNKFQKIPGIVHRSPEIKSVAGKRIILRIDV